MERALAASGLPRRDAEAPEEYLARVLDEIEISPRATGRLTALFAWARFSVHDVRPEMKDEAIETLEQVQRRAGRGGGRAGGAARGARRREADRPRRSRSGSPSRRGPASCSCSCPAAPRSSGMSGSCSSSRSASPRRVGALLRAVPMRPSAFDAAFAPRRRTRARPASLERVEREVALASGTAFDVHYRLRPRARGPWRRLCSLRRGRRPRAGARAGADAARHGAVGPRPSRACGARRPHGARPPARDDRARRRRRWSASDAARGARAPRGGGARRGRAGRRRQARPARARARRPPRRRPRPARGRPGPREDADGAVVRDGDRPPLLARPVHARPPADGRHGLVDLEPARARVRVPPGPRLLEPPPRRRDQPRPAEDAGGAARGDAGAPGVDRRDDPRARAAVPRARDAEPHRVRGHVPAARGAARPVRAAHGLRLPDRRRRVGDARAAARARRGRGRAPSGGRPRDAARDAARRRGRPRRRERRPLRRRPRRGDAREPQRRGRVEPARLARAAQALALPRRAGGPRLRDAGRRQERSRCPRSPTGSSSAPSSGCSGAPARTSCATSSTTVRTPSTERVVTRLGGRAARRLRGARRRWRSSPRSRSAGPSSRCSPRRSPSSSRWASGCRRRALRAWVDLDRERALEGDELEALVTVRADTAVDRLEIGLALPPGLELAEGGNPVALRLAAGEERELPLRAALRALDRRPRSATSGFAPATASGLVRFEGRVDRRRPLARLPRARAAPAPRHAGPDAGGDRERGRAGARRGPRVRRHAPVRPRRPRPVGQLARHAPAAASLVVNERHPERNADVVIFLDSFAEARATRRGHARAGRPRRRDPRRPLPRAPRPGRSRRVRRHPPLARARRRARAALPPRRRAARDGRRVQLRLEGRQRHPGAHAAAAGALVLAVTPLLDERSVDGARRPARRAATTSSCSRSRPSRTSSRRRTPLERARTPALAAPAGGAARPLRAPRRRRRDAGRRDDARGGTGGGEGIPTSRPPGAAVAAGVAAVAVVAGPRRLARRGRRRGRGGAGARARARGSAADGRGARSARAPRPRPRRRPAARYAGLLAVDDPPLDARAAGVAAALLVVGELVGWSRELATTTRDEPGGAWRRPVWIARLGLGALLARLGAARARRPRARRRAGRRGRRCVCALAALLVARRLARGPQPSG